MDVMLNGDLYLDDKVRNFSPGFPKHQHPLSQFNDEESPAITDGDSYSEEELFHLEMSDEGSGGKRSKLQYDNAGGSPVSVPPQKRGAVHPLGTSATDMTTKKARKMAAVVNDGQCTTGQQLRQPMEGVEDDDPHMAKAAVFYLLVLEDQLVAKNFYEGKNRIHPKSISITVQHRRKLLDWLYRVNLLFGYHFDTWVLTSSILDRFLSAQPIEKDIFQLAGCSAFLIAAKHEERFPPKISELVNLCAKCYWKIDFLKMEQIMLRVLEWSILTPTVNGLVQEVSLTQKIEKNFSSQFLTQIIKKIIFHSNLAYMPPSIVAFSLLSASDRYANAEDVDKTFKYLLYLLKQDPDDNDDDFTH